jgi:hypothetical protein
MLTHGRDSLCGDVLIKRASRAARSMCPLTRRNCLPSSAMPAAHQRNAICPPCQCCTSREWVRAMEIIDSMLFALRPRAGQRGRDLQARRGQRFGQAFAQRGGRDGVGALELLGQGLEMGHGQRGHGVVGLAHPLFDYALEPLGQPVLDVFGRVLLTPSDHRMGRRPGSPQPRGHWRRRAPPRSAYRCPGRARAARPAGR